MLTLTSCSEGIEGSNPPPDLLPGGIHRDSCGLPLPTRDPVLDEQAPPFDGLTEMDEQPPETYLCTSGFQRTSAPIACGNPGRCSWAEDNPNTQLHWSIVLEEQHDQNGDVVGSTREQLVAEAQCIAAALKSSGASWVRIGGAVSVFIGVHATWQQLQPALYAKEVARIDVNAPTGFCERLPLDECQDSPFCFAFGGRPLDKERDCLLPEQTMACVSGLVCGDLLAGQADACGNCWFTSSTCDLEGFDYSSESSCHDVWQKPICED